MLMARLTYLCVLVGLLLTCRRLCLLGEILRLDSINDLLWYIDWLLQGLCLQPMGIFGYWFCEVNLLLGLR